MGFDLEIIFQGMCTFVPERDGKKLWVLMGDLAAQAPQLANGAPPHAAAIRFPLESVLEGTPGIGLYRLENVDLRLNSQGDGGVDFHEFDAASNRPSSSTPGEHSFAWLSPLEEASVSQGFAGGGVIDPRFLRLPGKLAGDDAALLAARLYLTEGIVSTRELAGFRGKAVESAFRPPGVALQPNHLVQPTAARVSFKTFVDADSVTIEASRLRSGHPDRALTLRPTGVARKSLTIEILNEEADSLLNGFEGTQIALQNHRPQDLIFLSMFTFCRTPPPVGQQPMPIPERISTVFPGISPAGIIDGAPPCSPGRGILPSL